MTEIENKKTPLWKIFFLERRLPFRFYKTFYKYIYKTKRGIILLRGYKYLDRGMHFDVFIKPKTKHILKITNNFITYYHINYSKEYFERYKSIITSAHHLPIIGRHINLATEVKKDGSYSSPYIKGYLLYDLSKKKNFKVNKNKLKSAITELLGNLRKYNKKYGITGDWDIHELIYSPRFDRIINVDLDGFFSRKINKDLQRPLSFFVKQLNDLKKKL